jgi:bifunctional ADP-heptose synthase (sugar kinase/adenylyltransferase)
MINQKVGLRIKFQLSTDSAKDVAGAGDSLLVASALTLAAGGTIWESAFLGSLAAAIQVGRVGNIPVLVEELFNELSR